MNRSEDIIDLHLPERSMTNQILPKYKIKEHADASRSDEKTIHQVIEEVKITHILNQATTDIPPMISEVAEYRSLFVLHIQLRQPRRLHRISEILMGAINSSLFLIFQYGEKFAFASALRGRPAYGLEGWVSKEILVTDFIEIDQYVDAQPIFPRFLPANIEQLVQYYHLKVRQIIALQLGFPQYDETPTYIHIQSTKSRQREIEKLTKEAQNASSIAEQVRLNQQIATLRRSLFEGP